MMISMFDPVPSSSFPSARNRGLVQQSLSRINCKTRFLSGDLTKLTKLSEKTYKKYLVLFERISEMAKKAGHSKGIILALPPMLHMIAMDAQILGKHLEEIKKDFLLKDKKGDLILNLTGLIGEYDRWEHEDRESKKGVLTSKVFNRMKVHHDELSGFIVLEKAIFKEKVLNNKDATMGDIIGILRKSCERLDQLGIFRNIVFYRPLENGNWKLETDLPYFRGAAFGQESGIRPVEIEKESTAAWIILHAQEKGMANKFYAANINDPETFKKQGLPFHAQKAAYDKEQTKGLGRIFWILITNENQQGELLVQFNDRFSIEDQKTPFPRITQEEICLELLQGYFDEVVIPAVNEIRRRGNYLSLKEKIKVSSSDIIMNDYLSSGQKRAILEEGELLIINGKNVRLFESPAEKFYKGNVISGMVGWLRTVILSIYEGTKNAEGKTTEQLIRALSIEDVPMQKRVIYTRYLALLEGEAVKKEDLEGVVSGEVLDINGVKGRFVYKVPEAMIRRGARGNKMEVAISSKLARRVSQKIWAEMGGIYGFFHMVFHGLPIYATTQSLRVLKDMLRLKNLSILRVAQGKDLLEEQKLIIQAGSEGKADARGLEKEAYGGRIAIDEEEKEITLRKIPFDGIPFLQKISKWVLKDKREEENAELVRLIKKELGINGRTHLVGYYTVGVWLQIKLELFWLSLLGGKNKR